VGKREVGVGTMEISSGEVFVVSHLLRKNADWSTESRPREREKEKTLQKEGEETELNSGLAPEGGLLWHHRRGNGLSRRGGREEGS